MTYNPDVYGYVNGKAVYSRDEFIFECRRFGPIESDDQLMAYAEKVTHGWYNAGWKRKFIEYYLSDSGGAEPYASLTKTEYARLKELQKAALAEHRAAEEAKQWRKIGTYGYADNSVEEVWEDKDGNRKTVMTVYPHGDAC